MKIQLVNTPKGKKQVDGVWIGGYGERWYGVNVYDTIDGVHRYYHIMSGSVVDMCTVIMENLSPSEIIGDYELLGWRDDFRAAFADTDDPFADADISGLDIPEEE